MKTVKQAAIKLADEYREIPRARLVEKMMRSTLGAGLLYFALVHMMPLGFSQTAALITAAVGGWNVASDFLKAPAKFLLHVYGEFKKAGK